MNKKIRIRQQMKWQIFQFYTAYSLPFQILNDRTVVHGWPHTGLNQNIRTKLTSHGPDRNNYVPAVNSSMLPD